MGKVTYMVSVSTLFPLHRTQCGRLVPTSGEGCWSCTTEDKQDKSTDTHLCPESSVHFILGQCMPPMQQMLTERIVSKALQ